MIDKIIDDILFTVLKSLGLVFPIAVLVGFASKKYLPKNISDAVKQYWKWIRDDRRFLLISLYSMYVFMIIFRTLINRPYWENPFSDIIGDWGFHYKNGRISAESILNWLLLIPFSFLTLELRKVNSYKNKILWIIRYSALCSFAFSLMIEVSQVLFRRGTFQLCDLFYNSLGGITGGIFFLLWLKTKEDIDNSDYKGVTMKKVFAGIFLMIETAIFVLVIASFAYYRNYEAQYTGTAVIYGKDAYPLEEEYASYRERVQEDMDKNLFPDNTRTSSAAEGADQAGSGGILSAVSAKIRLIEDKIEKYTDSQSILGKQKFVVLKRKTDKMFGLDMANSLTGGHNDSTDVRDTLGETKSGQLGWVQDWINLDEQLQNMVDFARKMQEQGRNIVVLENPNKYADLAGYKDVSGELYERIHTTFSQAGIDLIDCGEEMHALGMSDRDIFYNTDFHWKPSAGITACKILGTYLNENCGYSMDTELFDLDQFDVEVQKKDFLGFLGKKVTLEYTRAEDFEIYTPKYDTNITVWNSMNEEEKTGTIAETLFWEEQLDVKSLYSGNKYEFYGYSDQAIIRVHNNLLEDDSHILVMKTSYGNCMTPFLTSAVEQLDILDPRAFDGSIMSFIEETDPDTIVLVYGLSAYEEDSHEGSMFDFR